VKGDHEAMFRPSFKVWFSPARASVVSSGENKPPTVQPPGDLSNPFPCPFDKGCPDTMGSMFEGYCDDILVWQGISIPSVDCPPMIGGHKHNERGLAFPTLCGDG